jgi:hypothetical protein
MSVLQEKTLTDTIRGFGYSDILSFAREQALRLVEQQIADYEQRISAYEKKYGMSYKEFCMRFHELSSSSLFEREDDGMDWEAAIAAKEGFSRDAHNLAA